MSVLGVVVVVVWVGGPVPRGGEYHEAFFFLVKSQLVIGGSVVWNNEKRLTDG